MNDKPKCSQCNERDVFSKGLCSGCYGRQWREKRKAERAVTVEPKQLVAGTVESDVIEGEIIHDDQPAIPATHLTATSPAEMAASRDDLRMHLEQKLAVIERDIVEANAALNEARRNGWATSALTNLRNRAVDDETYYNKILAAVEAGHTLIPEFPIEVFAIRRSEPDRPRRATFNNAVNGSDTFLGEALSADCAPVGVGEYRNPQPQTTSYTRENLAPKAQERGEPRWYTTVRRTGNPVGPIFFPSMTARSPIMRATAEAMKDKVFDQIGVCHPVIATAGARRVETASTRVGDPLVIGQILHKRVGSKQKCASFIIAWHLNLNDL